jgi:hypothetical protein
VFGSFLILKYFIFDKKETSSELEAELFAQKSCRDVGLKRREFEEKILKLLNRGDKKTVNT